MSRKVLEREKHREQTQNFFTGVIGWPVKSGRVFLVPCKKWFVQCTIANTGQATFHKVTEKHGHATGRVVWKGLCCKRVIIKSVIQAMLYHPLPPLYVNISIYFKLLNFIRLILDHFGKTTFDSMVTNHVKFPPPPKKIHIVFWQHSNIFEIIFVEKRT